MVMKNWEPFVFGPEFCWWGKRGGGVSGVFVGIDGEGRVICVEKSGDDTRKERWVFKSGFFSFGY